MTENMDAWNRVMNSRFSIAAFLQVQIMFRNHRCISCDSQVYVARLEIVDNMSVNFKKINLEGILLLNLYQMEIFSLYLFMTLRVRVVKKTGFSSTSNLNKRLVSHEALDYRTL